MKNINNISSIIDQNDQSQPILDDILTHTMKQVAASLTPKVMNFGVENPLGADVPITVIVMPTPQKKIIDPNEAITPAIGGDGI